MCGVGAEIVKAAQVTNEPLIGTDFICRAQIIGLTAEIARRHHLHFSA